MDIVPLDGSIEDKFFNFLNRDRVLNFFAVYDLKKLKTKTLAWIAVSREEILGYLLQYDRRVITLRGEVDCASKLLEKTNLVEATFNVEPRRFPVVKNLFEFIEPTEPATLGNITTLLVMVTDGSTFRPIVKHRVKRLGEEDLGAIPDLWGERADRILSLLKDGVAYGLYRRGKLVSFAASPNILDDIAIIRGVLTSPAYRGRSYAASVCSGLVRELIERGRRVMLYVSKDNHPGVRVYERLGFREVSRLLSLKARGRIA